jgi:hypothetical protein
MFLFQVQPPPPDNSGYMIAGYAVIFGIMVIYVASLFLRQRSMKRDLEILEKLEDGE